MSLSLNTSNAKSEVIIIIIFNEQFVFTFFNVEGSPSVTHVGQYGP